MNRIVALLALLVPVGVAVGGCSASGADPKYSSGVNGDLGLTTLTPQQQQTICTSQAAFLKAHVDTTSLTRFWCAFTPAVLTAANQAACETAMNDCVNTFSIQLDVTATDPNAPPPQCTTVTTDSCTGTVSQYEDCVDALASVQLQIGTNWQCGSELPSSPTVGVDACNALGPTCTAVTGSPDAIH